MHKKVENRKRKVDDSSPDDDPYPHLRRPTPEECEAVRENLMSFHGFPQEFAKYRRGRGNEDAKPKALDEEGESVLDGLVSTLLSQNTTDANSTRAFASLKSLFPTWEHVLAAESKCIENAIRCGGLAVTKASCIKNILGTLHERKGKICLEYLRDMPVDDIKAELCHFKGIGPKTKLTFRLLSLPCNASGCKCMWKTLEQVACVLMFHLQRDDFPVDTHVFQITKSIGWVPASADREKAYRHLNRRIPDELKFDLNCLLVTHGKLCMRCAKKGGKQQRRAPHEPCPLTKYCLITE